VPCLEPPPERLVVQTAADNEYLLEIRARLAAGRTGVSPRKKAGQPRVLAIALIEAQGQFLNLAFQSLNRDPSILVLSAQGNVEVTGARLHALARSAALPARPSTPPI
jgi:hypothetical protein